MVSIIIGVVAFVLGVGGTFFVFRVLNKKALKIGRAHV